MVKMNLSRYQINATEYLEIRTEDLLPLDQVYSCYILDIWFVGLNQEFKFADEDAGSFCCTIQHKIPKLLNKNLVIDPKKSADLGFLLNQESQNIEVPEYGCSDYYFFGNSYSSERRYYSSWMYNDLEGNIILEICPKYSWNDEDEHDVNYPDFVSYDQFMKNYQPIIVRTIEPKYLRQWLHQVNILDPIFEKNEHEDLTREDH